MMYKVLASSTLEPVICFDFNHFIFTDTDLEVFKNKTDRLMNVLKYDPSNGSDCDWDLASKALLQASQDAICFLEESILFNSHQYNDKLISLAYQLARCVSELFLFFNKHPFYDKGCYYEKFIQLLDHKIDRIRTVFLKAYAVPVCPYGIPKQ